MISATKYRAGIVAVLLASVAGPVGCVDHRDIRTEVYDENVYLPKDFMVRENPHRPGSGDHSWLFKMTVVKASQPDHYGYPMVPGTYSSARNVRFQFSQDSLQMVDDNELWDDQDNPSMTSAVLNAWPGTHVDIKLRENLNGEITNVKEENREQPWKERQHFKVDLTAAGAPDLTMLAWYQADDLNQCLELVDASLVPDSVEIEQEAETGGDDYVSWTMALTYRLKLIDGRYYCGNLITDQLERNTATYEVKYSLWRLPASDYQPVEIAEKEPMRKVVGAWETGIMMRLAMFKDKATEMIGARSFMVRFDPAKQHTFYFSPSFPEAYKDHFRVDIAGQFNQMMEEAGSAMRIAFEEHDYDGKVRKMGDPRYSFIHYHKVPAGGVIGLAEMVFDPRTGETLSSTMNMYDWIDGLYAHLVQDYITEVTKDEFTETSTLPTPCEPGTKAALDQQMIVDSADGTSLYAKMQQYMEQPVTEWVPQRDASFGEYMRKLMPDMRYAVPWWNSYVNASPYSLRERMAMMRQKEQQFRALNDRVDRGESPFGINNVLAPGAIEKGVEAIRETKDLIRNHMAYTRYQKLLYGLAAADTLEGWELARAMARSARMCKADGSWETQTEWRQRLLDGWFKLISTHEFGHNLGLRHNFYGNMDTAHMQPGQVTSSVMEYAFTFVEAAEDPLFKPHDVMSLKYIYGGVKPDENENWLFCTDEHAYFSPLCTPHDIGTRPTELVKNEIDYYEWFYKFRNFRGYRKFWNTAYYGSGVLNTLYSLRRLLNLWVLDWPEDEIKNDLNLLGVQGDEFFFRNITEQFNDEMGQANRMVANFYKAILQQSAGERSYATKFDNFHGDVTQQGIILDKYYAMFMFLGLWPVDDYDQNIYSYLAYHESSFGNSQYWSNVQDVVDSMIGGQYDVYPWFKPLAVLLFAQDTHDVMYSDYSKQKWIEMRKFDRAADMVEFFGFDPRDEAVKVENPYQEFRDSNGSTWIYYYVEDRDRHLVASKDWNPVAFKILRDQNERVNLDKNPYVDDYEIKYYLDFYEYFN